MQSQKVSSGTQAEDVPGIVTVAAELGAAMPNLLVALDAAEAASDQARAEMLIAKIYEIMDSTALPDREPA